MAEENTRHRPIPLLAMLLAWIVPGAGHAYLRRPVRGAVIFAAVAATFWGGVAIGGVMTVDHRAQKWWFTAQAFTGTHALVSWRRTENVYRDIVPEVREIARRWRGSGEEKPQLYEQIVYDTALAPRGLVLTAPVESVARAYTGVAGLLNLLCIFDATVLALMGKSGEPSLEDEDKKQKHAGRGSGHEGGSEE